MLLHGNAPLPAIKPSERKQKVKVPLAQPESFWDWVLDGDFMMYFYKDGSAYTQDPSYEPPKKK